MSAADSIRPAWLPGLNNISGSVDTSLQAWVIRGDYAVYKPIEAESFELAIDSPATLLESFAFDCSRMAIAASESALQNSPPLTMAKSTGWQIVKMYYAAFYAAHAISRILGHSFTYLEQVAINRVRAIADVYGQQIDSKFGKAQYECIFKTRAGVLQCTRLGGSKGGSHEDFWKGFLKVMRELQNEIIKSGSTPENLEVINKLAALTTNLCRKGNTDRGAWLCKVRNDVNYSHGHGAWFPYRAQSEFGSLAARDQKNWTLDPLQIDLKIHATKDSEVFFATCNFIVSLCRALCEDMANRCATGKSFHHNGYVAFDRLHVRI